MMKRTLATYGLCRRTFTLARRLRPYVVMGVYIHCYHYPHIFIVILGSLQEKLRISANNSLNSFWPSAR